MSGYQIVSEALIEPFKLYHGSPVQNLKTLNPSRISSNNHHDGVVVSATEDIKYAAAFTFKNSTGDKLDKRGRHTWYSWRGFTDDANVININSKFKNLILKTPCSIYIVDKKHFSKSKDYDEYISTNPVRVIKELKYKNTIEALEKNGVEVRFI